MMDDCENQMDWICCFDNLAKKANTMITVLRDDDFVHLFFMVCVKCLSVQSQGTHIYLSKQHSIHSIVPALNSLQRNPLVMSIWVKVQMIDSGVNTYKCYFIRSLVFLLSPV